MADFFHATFDSLYSEYVLCLCSHKDPEYFASGTGVIVGPGLAVTAKHVVEDYFKYFDNTEFIEGKFENRSRGSFSMFAVNPLTKAEWKIDMIYFISEKPDVAFLSMIPENDNAKNTINSFAKINLNPPKVGDFVFACGYIEKPENPDPPAVVFGDGTKRSLAYTRGAIKEVHLDFRDVARLNFPCFQTDARFDGGMSGGPVFNVKGEVIGLVCSSMPPWDADDNHVSYVTLLWPAMLITLPIPPANVSSPTRTPALHLAQQGFMNVLGSECCKLLNRENGVYKEIRFYYPPEK